MKAEEIEKIKKAGEIARKTVEYAKSIVRPSMPLLELAEKIESKIHELGGKPAFPVTLSINEVAAHSTPSFDDTSKAHGLLKVDLGVHLDGLVADTAFSVDLENNEENKKLIESAEKALSEALKEISKDKRIREIGKVIEQTVKSMSSQPIINLSGHSIEQYNLHSGTTIPNYDNSQEKLIGEGLFAIEPFTTNGAGIVRDGRPSGIYSLTNEGNVRDEFAREILAYISEEYQTLPFCSRWLYKKFGSRALLALKRIEDAGMLHNYSQLIEKNKGKVAQAEHTVLITDKEKIIIT